MSVETAKAPKSEELSAPYYGPIPLILLIFIDACSIWSRFLQAGLLGFLRSKRQCGAGGRHMWGRGSDYVGQGVLTCGAGGLTMWGRGSCEVGQGNLPFEARLKYLFAGEKKVKYLFAGEIALKYLFAGETRLKYLFAGEAFALFAGEKSKNNAFLWFLSVGMLGCFLPMAASAALTEIPQSQDTQWADRDVCSHYAADAERAWGLPTHLLWAIGMVESKRDGGPWPWTLDVAGHGLYFDTRAQAENKLSVLIRAQGRQNVDIGCMQVNWHWHQTKATSPEVYMDPRANTYYAAYHLHELWVNAGQGPWDFAIGKYHSPHAVAARDYACMVLRYLGRVEPYSANTDYQSKIRNQCGGYRGQTVTSAAVARGSNLADQWMAQPLRAPSVQLPNYQPGAVALLPNQPGAGVSAAGNVAIVDPFNVAQVSAQAVRTPSAVRAPGPGTSVEHAAQGSVPTAQRRQGEADVGNGRYTGSRVTRLSTEEPTRSVRARRTRGLIVKAGVNPGVNSTLILIM